MLRLNKLTDYAIVMMAYLTQAPHDSRNAKQIAEQTGVSLPTASKLLKRLTRCGLLNAHRGIKGGYQLAYPSNTISLGQIIRALEGPIGLTDCSHAKNGCSLEKDCRVRDNWRTISALLEEMLFHVSISDLIQPSDRLPSLLKKPCYVDSPIRE